MKVAPTVEGLTSIFIDLHLLTFLLIISQICFAVVTRSSSVGTRRMCFYGTFISGNYSSLSSNECLYSVMHIEHCKYIDYRSRAVYRT
jgi:hypothetical protein